MKANAPEMADGRDRFEEVGTIGDLSDGQLLDRFIAARDEAAFETLIERHGAMVWGVCRRVLGRHHDAEDAFQATFLVLATKAAAVVPRTMLPNWLYGVAYQTAARARAAAAKRQQREKHVAVVPEPEPKTPRQLDERLGLLDRELQALPDKYRAPIVLCELEALTHQEAALRLDCPVGTLSARLSRGRALLAKRLGRRGAVLSASGLGLLLAQDAVAGAMRASVASSTAKAATLFVRGVPLVSGAASVDAMTLAQGVINTMWLVKLKTVGTIVASLVLLGAATTLLLAQSSARSARPAEPQARAKPAGAETPPNLGQTPPDRAPFAAKPASPSADKQVALQAPPAQADAAPAKPAALPANAARIWNAALSPDGRRVAAGAEKVGGRPSQLIVWELESRRELVRVSEPRASRSVAFSPDGQWIATGGFGRVARCFDARTGQTKKQYAGHMAGINAVAFSPDGQTLATGSWDKTVRLWNVATGKGLLTLKGHTDRVFGVAFSPDGKTVASCGVDQTARVWNTASGEERLVLTGHTDAVECVTYSPDGKTIVTAGWDATLRLWDASTGRQLAELEGPSQQIGVGFSPDGKMLASLSDPVDDSQGTLSSMLIFWDVAERKQLAMIPAHSARSYSVLFTPDGKKVITSSLDRTIKVWDVATRRNTATFTSVPSDGDKAPVP